MTGKNKAFIQRKIPPRKNSIRKNPIFSKRPPIRYRPPTSTFAEYLPSSPFQADETMPRRPPLYKQHPKKGQPRRINREGAHKYDTSPRNATCNLDGKNTNAQTFHLNRNFTMYNLLCPFMSYASSQTCRVCVSDFNNVTYLVTLD